jgi:protein-tyrosine phosphatase
MIDIHSHILPGLDDGARDIEEALEMCALAAQDGIKTIVATPHNLNGVFNNKRETVLRATRLLNDAVRERGIDIVVLPGSDTHMDAMLLEELEEKNVTTINDARKFLLLELPNFVVPEHVRNLIFELKLRGITPVISHPERNDTIMGDTEILHELIRTGALVQITAGCVTGHFGRKNKKNACRLIESNMAHILATDAHNTTSRPPLLSRAVRLISKKIGAEEARKMVVDAPESLINGMPPPVKEPLKKKRKAFFPFFGPKNKANEPGKNN